jgi:mannose-6-phosphate isomerase-like protein (cupin superfamily)
MERPVNLADKLALFRDHWAPRIVATYNDNDVRVVRVEGEFIWHSHAETDDLFLVLTGELDIDLRERTVTLGPGELFVVPKGVEHRPAARRGEVTMLLMEPTGTLNTGDPETATAAVQI